MMPKPHWLIDGILPSKVLGLLYGKGGTYKSFLALDWSLCIALGLSWNGHAVIQGPVVYVAAEAGEDYFPRLEGWAKYHGISDHELDDAPFHLIPTPVQLLRQPEVIAFLDYLQGMPEPPRLVVIDTLGRSMDDGDEDKNSDMHRAMSTHPNIRGQVLMW